MKTITLTMRALTLVLLFALTACAPKPPGPAERLGKTLDQLTTDITDISKEMDDTHTDGADQEEIKVKRKAPARDESWKTRPYDQY